jgi:hypothetical protein
MLTVQSRCIQLSCYFIYCTICLSCIIIYKPCIFLYSLFLFDVLLQYGPLSYVTVFLSLAAFVVVVLVMPVLMKIGCHY